MSLSFATPVGEYIYNPLYMENCIILNILIVTLIFEVRKLFLTHSQHFINILLAVQTLDELMYSICVCVCVCVRVCDFTHCTLLV